MLNSSINYPYPLLRTEPIDYKTSTFKADVNVKTLLDGYEVIVKYEVDNEEIKCMLAQGSLSFALEIQCISTWYRKLELSDSNEQRIVLSSAMVHERVDLCPCIVANDNIPNFYSSDFSDEFLNILTPINKGEVVAIGERKKFDALYKDDIIKKTDSIVSLKNDERAKTVYCEWEYPTIQLHVPSKEYEKYNQVGINESRKIPLLNAIYIVPVIVEALTHIYHDECQNGDGSLTGYAWYKTLKYFVAQMANNDVAKYKKMLSEPVKLAQLLLDENAKRALDVLSEEDL